MRTAPLALFLLATVLAGCGDDGGDGAAGAGVSYSAEVSDAEIAAGACGLLVGWTNDVADRVNRTEGEMTPEADLPALMEATLDDVIARTRALHDDLAGLDYPDTDGGRAFAEDLISGAAAAQADVEGFREDVRAIPDPDPETYLFRKQQMVVELEKPRSLVKPDVQGDLGDEELEAAIQAEDSCRFVTRTQ